METRTTWSKVTFLQPFALPGSEAVLPAGDYELLVKEERLDSPTFDAYRRTVTFLHVNPDASLLGRTDLRLAAETALLSSDTSLGRCTQ